MQITQSELKEFFDDSITVKRKNELTLKINQAVHYVVQRLALIGGYEVDYYDYANASEDGTADGYFDTENYGNKVFIIGEFNKSNKSFNKYQNQFPTSWLWDDEFEEKVREEIHVANESARLTAINKAQRQNKDQEQFEKIKASIVAKLTTEELAIIDFVQGDKMSQRVQMAFALKEANTLMQALQEHVTGKLLKKDIQSYQKWLGQTLGTRKDLSSTERKRIMQVLTQSLYSLN